MPVDHLNAVVQLGSFGALIYFGYWALTKGWPQTIDRLTASQREQMLELRQMFASEQASNRDALREMVNEIRALRDEVRTGR